MKKYLLIVFVSLSALSVSAQNLETSYKYELSFNAAFVVQNILALEPNTQDLDPYIFQIRKYSKSGKAATRLAVGANVTIDNSSPDFFTERKTSDSSLRFRIGREWRIPISEKAAFTLGLDVVSQYYNQKVLTQGNLITTTREFRWLNGVGGAVGIAFNLGKRGVAGLESSYSALYDYRKTRTKTNDGAPDTVFVNEKFNTLLDQPYALYFGFKF